MHITCQRANKQTNLCRVPGRFLALTNTSSLNQCMVLEAYVTSGSACPPRSTPFKKLLGWPLWKLLTQSMVVEAVDFSWLSSTSPLPCGKQDAFPRERSKPLWARPIILTDPGGRFQAKRQASLVTSAGLCVSISTGKMDMSQKSQPQKPIMSDLTNPVRTMGQWEMMGTQMDEEFPAAWWSSVIHSHIEKHPLGT